MDFETIFNWLRLLSLIKCQANVKNSLYWVLFFLSLSLFAQFEKFEHAATGLIKNA